MLKLRSPLLLQTHEILLLRELSPCFLLPFMDSSCSPSLLSLKGLKADRDRPRTCSRIDDVKRPAGSFSRSHSSSERNGADRTPDKASPGFSSSASRALSGFDGRERGDGGREFWRKGYGGSGAERESGDGFDESGERMERAARNSPRTVQGYERADRHHVVKPFASERDRSERSDCPRTPFRRVLEHDRESFDKADAVRATARRFYAGDCRQETAEGSNYLPSQEERAARKGSCFDKDMPGRGFASRDAAGKGSSGSERDGQEGNDPRRSPSWQGAGTGKDAFKISPRRARVQDRGRGAWESGKGSAMRDFGPEKDGMKTPKNSPRKSLDAEKDGTEMHKISPRKAYGTDRDSMGTEEMYNRASPRSKGFCNIEEEKSSGKAHKVSSSEGYARVWNRSNSSSRANGWKQDVPEEQKPPGFEGHDEGSRKRSPDAPPTFSHIGRRGRSERDRWRREEPERSQSSKDAQPKDDGEELEEAGGQKGCLMEKPDTDMAVQEEESVNASNLNGRGTDETDDVTQVSSWNPDVSVPEPDERKADKEDDRKVSDSASSQGGKSEMEEGELEPEEETLEEEWKESETSDSAEKGQTDTVMEEQEKSEDSEDQTPVSKGKQDCERMLVEAPEGESQPNGCANGSCEDPQEFSKRCDNIEPREMIDMNMEHGAVTEKEDNKDLELQRMTTKASTARDIEVGESSKGGLTLNFLNEITPKQEMHIKQENLEMSKTGYDSSRELTLSLFMKPSGGEAASSKQKGHPTGSQSKLNEGFENGEQLQRVDSMELRTGKKGLADHREELGELSVHGHNQKTLKMMESLQLSLALPGTSVALAGANPPRPACFVEPERSFQSLTHSQNQTQNLSQTQTRTNSDGFTTSLSFSQSHSFVHNPSCSLNCTSVENQELSCGGSKQISQGTEWMSQRSWQTPSGNEQMSNGTNSVMSLSQDRLKHRREISLYQRSLQNGSMQSYQGFPSVTGSNRISGSNQISQRSHPIGHRFQGAPKVPDVSSQDLKGLERQGSVQKDFRDRLCQQKVWLASNCHAGSQETGSEPHVQPEREMVGEHPASAAKGFRNEDMIGGRNSFNEKIGLHEIAAEPVAVMAQKLQELPDSFLGGLRDLAKEMLGSFEKREEFITLQEIIGTRMDLTEETLLRAHCTQLEILVALKTGMQAFVQEGTKPLTYKALIEIFLQTRCQNINCQKPLSTCGCECRICSQKSGFCHECMCVVCCKFDSDDNTCRWVGCDVCLHRCHTDCGLRMSYIMPAPSIQGGAGTSEIQYQCVACDHRLELFGFVKEVFEKFADDWGAETLSKELDCVQRIFHGSEDMRGKQLCWMAERMLQKLENKVDAAEVRRSMFRFFNEGNAELDGARTGVSNLAHSLKPSVVSDRLSDAGREAILKTPSSAGNKVADLDKAQAALQMYDRQLEEKRTETVEQQYDRALKKADIKGLESAVWMKQAEAKMFQMRADEARQDAGGLQYIVAVKREKIEDEYACKYANLRLNEVEERRRNRFEELQALERAQYDYRMMKIRMKADIKDLLMKMEMTKQQFV